jgi:beta-N-acetylhexosaminidase
MSPGHVMIDIEGPILGDADRLRLSHPATGGVILFTRNYESPQQLQRLIASIHELRSPPLLIAVDQEGGRVQRFRPGFTRLPPAAAYLSVFDGDIAAASDAAREIAWLMATELRGVGVDFSFAPVLDVESGISEVIGDRAFAEDPEQVIALATAWIRGAREAGMISVGKHYPGHGAVAADSHLALPRDLREEVAIEKRDLRAFRDLIAQGLDAVMPAHVVYEACDPRPAGYSAFWLQEVLRRRLGFHGAVFSDDLSMAAAGEAGDYGERARAALTAGCDMVIVCNNPRGADAVLEAVTDGPGLASVDRLSRLYGRVCPPSDQRRRDAAVALASRLVAGR